MAVDLLDPLAETIAIAGGWGLRTLTSRNAATTKVINARSPETLETLSSGKFCPECGGQLRYDSVMKLYTCTSCGRMYTQSQLIEAKERLYSSVTDEDERRRKTRRDVLKWYLSEKDEKR